MLAQILTNQIKKLNTNHHLYCLAIKISTFPDTARLGKVLPVSFSQLQKPEDNQYRGKQYHFYIYT
uniref:Piwi domain-containing protein n=1 Tax=Elaeophora elaphi TaxID=1147741 RepID=A0A0R3RWQ3_9BILA